MKQSISVIAAGLVMMVVAGDRPLHAERQGERQGSRYQVTVTNLTAGQVFTPILAATHTSTVRLFKLGKPASTELEVLAESGDTGPLSAALRNTVGVRDVADSGAPLPPGHSVTLELAGGGPFDYVSVAAMLVPTNDAFFAVNGVEGPDGNRTVTLFAPAYDSGTELNDEDCQNIPGPPTVCQGEGFNPSRAGAEGFVHVHRGIHGGASLDAATFDWRNPVARITIRRVP